MASKSKYAAGVLGLVLAVGGVFAYLNWNALFAWYQVRGLKSASSEQLDWHINRIEKLGMPGIEAVISLLQSENEQSCLNASTALNHLIRQLEPVSESSQQVFNVLESQLPACSDQGRRSVQKLFHSLVVDEPYLQVENACAMRALIRLTDFPVVHEEAYDTLMEVVKSRDSLPKDLVPFMQALVRKGINDSSTVVRSASVRLAVCPSVLMQEALVPMLAQNGTEKSAEVRQLVILALGEHEALLSTDELCRFLNDESAEVVNTTIRALKVRGLSDGQIQLAQKMKSRDASVRAEVPDYVLKTKGIDSMLWLERLSKDPEPAVRAAVARALSQLEDQQTARLLLQLTQDKDPTVQEISQYYLKKR
ncbi:MAG: HEAT repeat domain-containing protein [Planctomycetia bacterium]|nr:HEAT repeat domain-containing protein [Planctomycetia bacterium]